MKSRTFALGGAAAVALAGMLSVTPVFAHTSHPATPEEMQQTDALNAQALANAQAGTPTAAPAPMTTAAAAPTTDTAMAPAPAAGATPLKSLASLPALNNAAVQASDGTAIGTVKDVVTGSDGKPSIVDVALADNSKTVALSAGELSYDASRNLLVASLSNEEIKSLPAAGG